MRPLFLWNECSACSQFVAKVECKVLNCCSRLFYTAWWYCSKPWCLAFFLGIRPPLAVMAFALSWCLLGVQRFVVHEEFARLHTVGDIPLLSLSAIDEVARPRLWFGLKMIVVTAHIQEYCCYDCIYPSRAFTGSGDARGCQRFLLRGCSRRLEW